MITGYVVKLSRVQWVFPVSLSETLFFHFWDTIFVIFERHDFISNSGNPTNRSLVAPSWQFFSACPSIAQIYCFYCFYIPRSRLYCAVKVSLGRKYLRNNNVIFAYLYLFRVSDSKRGTFIFGEILQVFIFFFFSILDLVNILLRVIKRWGET